MDLNGMEIWPPIWRDSVYSFKSWLMCPFQDIGPLTPAQWNFNKELSQAWIVVEHGFGQTKGRWRCLDKRMDDNTERIQNTIIACCVLNNMCILLQDDFDAPQGKLCLDQNVGKDKCWTSKDKRGDCGLPILISSTKLINIRNISMTVKMTSVFCLFNCEGFSFSFAIDYLNLLLICELEINVKKFNSYHTDFWLRWQSLRLTLFCNNILYTTPPTFDSSKMLPFYQSQTTYIKLMLN